MSPKSGSDARGGRAQWLVLLAVVAGWYVTVAPSALGGPMTPVLTRGVSMEPTFHAGDLAIAFRDRSPEIGDVVVARHPSGPLVLHRLVGRDADGLITQGDNLGQPDPWRTRPEDVLGTVRFSIGGAGRVLAVLRDPRTMGALAAAGVLAAGGLTAERRRRPTATPPPVAGGLLLVVGAVGTVGALGLAGGATASFEVRSDQLLGLIDPAPLEPTYLVTPDGGGGGGGGGGTCPPKKPTC